MDIADQIKICVRLLELYEIGNDITASDIKNFKAYKSRLYGFMNVYCFNYKNTNYYATDDYSLMDNPKFVENVLSDIIPSLHGKLLKNPITQSDRAMYASGLDGIEYYLWEAPLK